jgi:uncharacterized membrane protein
MEEILQTVSHYAILLFEAMALVILIWACLQAFVLCIVLDVFTKSGDAEKGRVWRRFLGLLVAALTFQLAADLANSTVSATWSDIGRLAAIAGIRTFLNYFLEKDVKETERVQGAAQLPERPNT